MVATFASYTRSLTVWHKIFIAFQIFLILTVIQIISSRESTKKSSVAASLQQHLDVVQIIVVTPTYRRPTRMPDLTRMANTLMHVSRLHWIIIEDSNSKNIGVEGLLQRSKIPYTYLAAKTVPGYPRRGWYQRRTALKYLRENTNNITQNAQRSVVYFGDDDNSYDIRLFTDYIRNVKRVGVWSVAYVGGAKVEAPDVVNGTVVGWNVVWNKKRKFAIDMAGFAVSLDLILNSTATFGTSCTRGKGAPETCFLEDLNLTLSDLEPFGFEQAKKEIYVWHTKTVVKSYAKGANNYGYFIE